jgi:glucose-1-phosphate thymidylyltransferase
MTEEPPSPADLVGVIPMAGQGARINPLPMSKELFPVGFGKVPGASEPRPVPVCLHLLRQMRWAGVTRACLVLRPGKWDIPAYLQDGGSLGLALSYLVMPRDFGVPFTVNQATPFVGDCRVAFGFPDIILQPDDVFSRLAERQALTGADAVLAAYPTDEPSKWGVIGIDRELNVYRVVEKPMGSDLRLAWAAAVWSPAFTRFLDFILSQWAPALQANRDEGGVDEMAFGDVLQAAIDAGLRIEAEIIRDGSALDIGRPETLRAILGDPLERARDHDKTGTT